MKVIEATTLVSDDLLARSKFAFRIMAQAKPIEDNREPLVYLKPTSTIMLDPFWDTPGDQEGMTYNDYRLAHPEFGLALRRTVWLTLQQAAQALPKSWTMVVKAGLRPLEVQLKLLDEVAKQARLDNPGFTPEQALEHARIFVTDPAILCPPHSTGAAVDIDIIDSNTKVRIDMGCPPNTDDESAFTHYDGLTVEQANNRKILLTAMLNAGFANLAYEWWHFSYGDQYWAAFYNQPMALYNIIQENNQQ